MMDPMKSALYISWLLLLIFACNYQPLAQSYNVKLNKNSTFKIRGSSNVNKFVFTYSGFIGDAEVVNLEHQENRINVSGNTRLVLRVDDFKPSNPLMTRDFRKMLHHRDHPAIEIELVRIFPNTGDPDKVFAMVILTIAGTKRLEVMPLKIRRSGEYIHCSTVYAISLKRYNLEAPVNVMGFVNVNDEVQIELQVGLTCKPIKK